MARERLSSGEEGGAATVAVAIPRPVPPGRGGEAETGTLSQWALIRLRFRKHRLALYSLYTLAWFYLLALGCEFFAPYAANARNNEYLNCPPMIPQFSFQEGLYAEQLVRYVDPLTLQSSYIVDRAHPVPLGFFVRGDPCRLWGLIPWERRFFGVERDAYARLHRGAVPGSPVFFLLGADRLGHDLFSRMVYGARISLSIGLVAIAISFILGLVIGGVSGYVGGRVDFVIQRLIEILLSFPHLPLWLALGAAIPAAWSSLRAYFAITVILSLLNWTWLARVVRGKILALREEDYAVAARLLGASHARVLFRHLIPGFTSHIIVTLTLSVPQMILAETALSFLGLGLRPPIVSWGVLLQDCLNLQVVASEPWLLLPVGFIVVTVLAFNFLGDGLRDAADPYASR